MLRFILNRWWAFALALALGFGAVASLPVVGYCDGGQPVIGDPNMPGSGDGSSGDPDIPINTGKSSKPSAGYGRAGALSMNRAGAGDATVVQVVWSYKYRIALQLFRAYVLRW